MPILILFENGHYGIVRVCLGKWQMYVTERRCLGGPDQIHVHLPACMSVYLPVCLCVCLSVCLYIYMSVCPMSVYRCVRLSVCLNAFAYVCLYISYVCKSVCQYLSILVLLVCLYVSMSLCRFVCSHMSQASNHSYLKTQIKFILNLNLRPQLEKSRNCNCWAILPLAYMLMTTTWIG